MKRIKNIVFIIVLFSIILIVYFNMDKIINYTKSFFVSKNVVVINEPNKYKRNFQYTKYKNYYHPEEFNPKNKKDLEEIIYNILNYGWDTFTFYCPDEYKTCEKDMQDLSNDQVKLSTISNYVSPYNSYKKFKTKMYIDGKIDVNVEKNYTDEEIDNINKKVEEIDIKYKLDQLDTKKRIAKLHDIILGTSKYDKTRSSTGKSEFNSNKANGPLLEGEAICSGYADAMAIFLDKYNIPNIKVASEKHVWNLVYINNKWYNVDLTWDLPIRKGDKISSAFLLISTKDLEKLDTTEHNYNKNNYPEAN